MKAKLLAVASVASVGASAIMLSPPDTSRPRGTRAAARQELHLYVDPERGRARAMGTRTQPLSSLAVALDKLREPLTQPVTIHLAAGRHVEVEGGTLRLELRMKGDGRVRLAGENAKFSEVAGPGEVVLDWESSARPYLIEVEEGDWSLENLQLGTRRRNQRQGISVRGPAVLELVNTRLRVGSQSGAALVSGRGAHVFLRGTIEINEDAHAALPEGPSFGSLVAEDHGLVQFADPRGSLSIGNGSLVAGYYGCIRLGCAEARITSWGGQSNNIAVNNSGRVDLHGTKTILRAARPTNSPIGLEHDGHVLAEGAHIVIECEEGGSGIVLQKSSTLYCQDIEFRGGPPKYSLLTYSGSDFAGDFRGDLHDVHATSGSTITIGKCGGQSVGPFQASKGGTVRLPDGRVLREELVED